MRRKNYSFKIRAKKASKYTTKTNKRNQKGGDLQAVPVFVN